MSWPAVVGVGTVLAPAGHAAVDEPRVAGEAHVGTDAEPLGDAGPEPLDQRVGPLDQAQHGLDALGVLEVDADRAPAPVEDVGRRRRRVAARHVAGAVDADDVGAHVGEHHGAERAGTDPGELDDPDAVEWSQPSQAPRSFSHGRPQRRRRVIASMIWARAPGRSWPMPSIDEQLGAGDGSAVRSPPLASTSGSTSPWMTSVGHRDGAQPPARRRRPGWRASWRRCRRVVAAVVGLRRRARASASS